MHFTGGGTRAELNSELQTIRNYVWEINSLNLSSMKTADPLDFYVLANYHYFNQGYFHDHYVEWRTRRIRKVMEIYGMDFKGKRVLEVGGGTRRCGRFFARLGADVVSLEGRIAKQQLAIIKHRNVPSFQSILCDVEKDFTHFGRFDLVINFGLIEVVENVDVVMDCCARMSDQIFLETMVCDSTDPDKIVYVDMAPDVVDHPLRGKSARPSPFYIERFYQERSFSIHRAFDADLNTYYHTCDWAHANRPEIDNRHRRFWYFTKDAGNPGYYAFISEPAPKWLRATCSYDALRLDA